MSEELYALAIREPYNVNLWIAYINSISADSLSLHDQVTHTLYVFNAYKHALQFIPRSYKLWIKHLQSRNRIAKLVPPVNTHNLAVFYEQSVAEFEKCVVFLGNMPLIWIEYAEFLSGQRRITETRRVFDCALQALPVTQHHLIWEKYIAFVTDVVPQELDLIVLKVYPRYLELEPNDIEDYIEALKKFGRFDEASKQLIALIDKGDAFHSKYGKSLNDFWSELCEILCKRGVNAIGSGSKQDGSSIDVEVVIRSAIDRYSSECGALWNALAEYFTRLGLFEKARDIYEEAIRKIMTARDFNIVFTAYSQFEESLVAIKLQGGGSSDEFDLDADDVDMRLFRLENLLDRRPFLINDVALRQNPNNVYEWLKRVQLFEESVKTDEEWMLTAPKVLKTFNDAVSTVDPEHASEEKLSKLWLDFSRFHENECNLIEAVRTFQRATEVDFKGVDEHATVWCAWAEFYIRQNQLDDALRILRKAVIVPSKRELQDAFTNKGGLTAKQRLYKSSKLWALLVDLEESLSSFETAKAVYDQILSLRVITPQIVLNYVDFLQKNKFFEESFRVFEKSISLFEYPLNIPLWSSYLLMFVDRFGKSKVDRARELYEEALKTIPKEAPELKSIFIMYADLEEKFGLARNALRIYDRATEDVIQQDQYEMYQLYIAKAASFFGLARTREIYEKAIHKLPEHSIKSMSMQYASVEVKLGEVDRARAVYTYAAQYCNPQRETLFWNTWQEFEVQYGNEDTFRDMLRLKRSVDADFKSRHFVELAAEVDANSREIESRKRKLVEAEEAALAKSQRNEEELNIDEEEDGAEEEKDHIEIQQQSVPSAVYQGITISE